MKTLTVEVISSFNINISSEDIESASKKEIKNDNEQSKHIMVVHFKDFETKIRTIRAKKNGKDNREIYFNASLTGSNRYFMMNAKKKPKQAGLKAFFSARKVKVEKHNKQVINIENEGDLDLLEKYINEMKNNKTQQFNKA